MPARDPALQTLLRTLVDGLASRAGLASPEGKAVARVRGALATAGDSDSPGVRTTPAAAGRWFLPALAAAKASGGAAAGTAAALEALEPRITWYCRQESEPICENFEDRHALATLIGPADRPGCLEVREDLRVGISLVAPGTPYPDHRHPPEELYLALTAGAWRQDLGPWFEPGPGGIVYNRPNILHGMRAGSEPQLALWCLPLP